ncbi:SAV_2336 N-terminal domain-related protein [Streptomyces sp. NPDC002994]|uniref:SAV_2336 N-terminal domain-related protein n=1 Tax=Streptomyces sp. NPDC002994 TaxID=3154441 RepID=UPI0033AE1121
MIDRLRRVLDGLGYPLGGEELLDVLLLARVMEGARTGAGDATAPDPAEAEEAGPPADDVGQTDTDEQGFDPTGSGPAPTSPTEEPVTGRRRFLFTDSRTARPATGTAARAVRVPGPRALPGAHNLARSLRPLRRHRDHPHRKVVDVEATVRLTAESGTLDVVLRPERELWHAAVLLVDDSPSMRVWRSLVPELGALLERSGNFRTVHVSRFTPQKLSPRHHRTGAGASVTFLLTDGVHPAWTSPVTADAVAAWGARGPVAVLNPLPQRLWRATRFQPQPHLLRATQRFPAADQVLMLDPLTGERAELVSGRLSLPVLALSPSSLASWAQLLTGPAAPHLVEATALEAPNAGAAEEGPGPATVPPDRLIAVFRGSFSPQAYRLAVRLSAIRPLSPLLIQLVRGATLPEATSAHVAEVLLGGLLERLDDDQTLEGFPESLCRDGLYDFRPGVRELLSSALSRTQAQEITEAVGRALEPYLGRLPDFSALMADASGTIRLPDGASPFAAVADPTTQDGTHGRPPSDGASTPASVREMSATFGGALLRASAGAVAADAQDGSLLLLLNDRYVRAFGHRPASAQVQAWERGLPALAGCLIDAGLSEVEMLVEVTLPMNSRRVDVILSGLDPVRSAPSYVLIELKQWTVARPDTNDPALCSVGTDTFLVLNPIDQVQRYREYLVKFNSLLARHPERVSGAVYLPNATEAGVDGLRDIEYEGGSRLFTGEHRAEFLTYLRGRFNGGRSGAEAADQLLRGKLLPPSKLTAVAAQEVKEGQFILLDEQQIAYRTVLNAVRKAQHSAHKEVVVITGGPGTGKSVIALHLLGELYRHGVPALHATGSQSLTKTLRKVAGSRKREVQDLFKYFNSFMTTPENSLDVLICDEAHRIRETSANRYTQASLRTGRPQIDELIDVARVPVFLLDEHQVVRPGEMGTVAEIVGSAGRKGLPFRVVALDSQFRCGGSDVYLNWVVRLLGLEAGGPTLWEPDGRMQLLVADSPEGMEAFLEDRRSEGYGARMTAGYCWPWSPEPRPGDPLPLDVVIGDWARPWNLRGDRSVSEAPPAALWATDPAGSGQVGTIYTAQGFEFDWSGVVIGPDMVWRGDRFVTDRKSSKDPALRGASDEETDRLIRNVYKVLLTRGMAGTVVYSTDAETRAKLLELGGRALGAHSRRTEKFEQLKTVRPEQGEWRTTRTDGTAPFTPAPRPDWGAYPALSDLFPWGSQGVATHRAWAVSPGKQILEQRWNQLVSEEDPAVKAELFKETRDRSTDRIRGGLPGRSSHGVPISQETSTLAEVVRIGMRSFDRQWLVADDRVIDQQRPGLWAALQPGQVFLNQPWGHPIESGPAVVATSLLPDMHHFNGRGGRVHPLLYPDGTSNVPPRLLPVLSAHLNHSQVSAQDVAAYVMAVAAHPGFTEHFQEEFLTPGVRVPLTRNPRLWEAAVRLGEEVLWASTYGEVCFDSASGRHHASVSYEPGDARRVRCLAPVGDNVPGEMRYDADTQTLHVGHGAFGPVPAEVWSYDVGGMNVLKKWFGYRKARPDNRKTSPLDDIHMRRWPDEWGLELIDLLTVLRRLMELAYTQRALLHRILAEAMVTDADLTQAGVLPVDDEVRTPRQPVSPEMFEPGGE